MKTAMNFKKALAKKQKDDESPSMEAKTHTAGFLLKASRMAQMSKKGVK